MSEIDVQGLLAKARWRQELNKRGYEGRTMASERLAETLRAELRAILDNDGKPFDLQVARHVYDFAIAAKDLLTVSVKTVEDAMKVVADNNGAMESLAGSNDPPPAEVASETFGARMLRELFALLPSALHKQQNDDPLAIVAAIANARERGMHDLAAKLEQKLIGTPLERPKITHAEVVHDSYEHGFLDGSMQDNFDRGTVDGVVGRDPSTWSPAYREGYEAGRARRATAALPSLDVHPPVLAIEAPVDGAEREADPAEPHAFKSQAAPHQVCDHCGKKPLDTIHTNRALFEAPEYSSNGVTL